MMMRHVSLALTVLFATTLVGCGQTPMMVAAPTAALAQSQSASANAAVVTTIKAALEQRHTDMTVTLSDVTVKSTAKSSVFTFTATKTTIGFTGRPMTETINGTVDMSTRKVVETTAPSAPETLSVAAEIEKAMTVRIPDASTTMVVTLVNPTAAPNVFQFTGVKTTSGFALQTRYDVAGTYNATTKTVKLTSQQKRAN